jgi:hypothetical protein
MLSTVFLIWSSVGRVALSFVSASWRSVGIEMLSRPERAGMENWGTSSLTLTSLVTLLIAPTALAIALFADWMSPWMDDLRPPIVLCKKLVI